MTTKEFIFGTWQIGGLPSFHDMSESEALSLLEYAYSLGIRSFDTAPIYGNGKSEMRIGDALKTVRNEIRIISKFGYTLSRGGSQFDVSREGIESQLEQSLERLKTDSIDTYLLHIPERIENPEDLIETLNSLVKKGLIHEYGLSNVSGTLLRRFLSIKEQKITVLQDFYNLIDRSIEQTIFPYIDESIEFMAYSPLYRGGLTERPMSEILNRNENALDMLFRNQGLKNFIRERKILEMVSERKGVSLKELAIEFLMHQPNVSSILFGTSSQKHLKEIFEYFQRKNQ